MTKLRVLIELVCISLFVVACRTDANRVFRVVNQCGFFETDDAHVLSCVSISDNELLIQTQSNEQALLMKDGSSVTLNGSLYSVLQPGQLLIASLEGVTIVSVQSSTRILQANTQIMLTLDEDGLIANSPPDPDRISISLDREALAHLPRQLALPPEILQANNDSLTDSQQAEGCIARADWTGTYTVQRGDSLSRIATSYAVSLDEIQTANCIPDSNRLATGQILRVPANVEDDSGASSQFWADTMTLQQGECTALSWDVVGASSIFIDEQEAPAQASVQICPTRSTSYNLRVVYTSGRTSTYPLTITVLSP